MVGNHQSEAARLAHELEQWIKKLKCSGSTGLSLESFTDIRIGVDPTPLDSNAQSYELYTTDELRDEKVQRAEFDSPRLEGKGILILPNGDTVRGHFEKCLRHGPCELVVKEPHGKVVSIRGEYRQGKLEGKARIYFQDRSWLEGYFKQGILHGFTRIFDKKGRLMFVSNHKNGKPNGVSWRIVRGGGCVVGRVDDRGTLTGIRIAYIYPDFMTALLGTFVDGIMQTGQQVQIVGIIEHETGIKIPLFSRPTGPQHCRQIGTFDFICSDPLVRDPYEATLVEIRKSTIDGAAEGLFTLQDIEPNTVLAFYNGSRASPEHFDPSTWETNNYRIFDPSNMPHGTIDIPVWAQDSKQYCASLAHKCNHSFLPNSEFVVFDHPKFGLIPCLLSIADIQKGEEVLVGYGYDLTDSPAWYQLAWKTSIFGRQGVNYKDWLNCSVKMPLGASPKERRGIA